VKVNRKILIVGAGIVGLATAYQLRQREPDAEITVLEKEHELGLHQTGRNSGVIHSGIYYLPGSAKALNCRAGRQALLEFCEQHEVVYELCGKVVVATNPEEIGRLRALYARGQANGVACRMINSAELAELEPHAFGLEAMHVPDAGIVDYRHVCKVLAREFRGALVTGAQVLEVTSNQNEVVVETDHGTFRGELLVNCAGLQCDRVCRISGGRPDLKIIPFKGEYYKVRQEAEHLCRHLIYPVPDPQFPFLGVHLTRMISGGVEVGPNAVLAMGREAYGKADVNVVDLFETLTYPGFIRMGLRHWKMGLGEMTRSFSKQAFVRALNRLCPELRAEHLVPAPSGIRAQALHRDGRLEDDFQIQNVGRTVHVLNAPSPAATASLAIGKTIAQRVDSL
jgi:(S)-2-hydroxyglutarate dehydrogenase